MNGTKDPDPFVQDSKLRMNKTKTLFRLKHPSDPAVITDVNIVLQLIRLCCVIHYYDIKHEQDNSRQKSSFK